MRRQSLSVPEGDVKLRDRLCLPPQHRDRGARSKMRHHTVALASVHITSAQRPQLSTAATRCMSSAGSAFAGHEPVLRGCTQRGSAVMHNSSIFRAKQTAPFLLFAFLWVWLWAFCLCTTNPCVLHAPQIQ